MMKGMMRVMMKMMEKREKTKRRTRRTMTKCRTDPLDDDDYIPRTSASLSVETDTRPDCCLRRHQSVHVFFANTLPQYARFIRWDHPGAVVIRRFDQTKHIFNLNWRYGQLMPIQRGFDPTIKLCKKKVCVKGLTSLMVIVPLENTKGEV